MTSGNDRKAELFAAFDKSEALIKQYERTTGCTAFTAINQLRYAGRHLLEGDICADIEQQNKQYEKALNHCHRAACDGYELLVAWHLAFINEVAIKKYSPAVVAEYIPDFEEIKEKAADAQAKLERSLSNKHSEIGDELENVLKELEAFNKVLKNKLPAIEDRCRQDSRKFVLTVLSIVLGFATLLVTIIGLLF